MRSIKLMEKSFKPGNPTRTEELKEFGRSKVKLTGIVALNAVRGILCLALENRAVGGKSKSGAITITSTTAINTKPTNLAQRFIIQLAIFYVPPHLVCQVQRSWPAWLACVAGCDLCLRYGRQHRSSTSAGWRAAISLECCACGEYPVTNNHLADLKHQVLLSFPWPTLLARAMPIAPISEGTTRDRQHSVSGLSFC